MKYTIIFLLVATSFLLSACTGIRNGKPTIKQGIFGKVVWVQGNVMPSPDAPNSGGGKPVQKIIRIYEQTKLAQVKGVVPLFSNIESKLVKTIKSDKDGYYQAKLLPGKYSLFTVEEENQFFANLFDGNGTIASFEVKANEITTYDIKINYKAFY